MSFVYTRVDSLQRSDIIGDGNCVLLIKHYIPQFRNISTQSWRQGEHVMSTTKPIARGTAIATFEHGRYPNRPRGNHAAFFMARVNDTLWVMEQWKGMTEVRSRYLIMKPQKPDGTWFDPSNNASAFYLIEL